MLFQRIEKDDHREWNESASWTYVIYDSDQEDEYLLYIGDIDV